MAEFSSNGKGNLGVTLGAIGTGLSILNGGLGNLGLGFCNPAQPAPVRENTEDCLTKFELYKEIMDVRKSICENQAAQSVVNCNFSNSIGILNNNVTSLQTVVDGVTKTIIPSTSVVTVTATT